MSTTKSTMPRIRRTVSPGYRPSVTLLVRPMNPPARQGEQAEEVDLKAGPYRSVVSANAERYTASDEEASHFGAEEPGVIFWGAWSRREAWRRPGTWMVRLRGVGHARCSCPDRGQRRQPGSIRWNRSGRSR